MKAVRGSTIKIKSTVYLDKDALTLANLTGSTIKTLLKADANDTDALALLTKTTGAGIVVVGDPALGICETTITAAESNIITRATVFVEVIAKLSDGSFIRSGIDRLELSGNVVKTLF